MNRDFTQKRASSYGVTGWVRNTADGKVEGEAQGDESSVQKLLKDVDRGPRLAHVVKLEKSEIESKEGEINFSILR
ncbi:Acylphosphatase-like domain containing protein [Elaphomyces granulatus]|uniref:acylphosphatase n=1 Tax=Elaphomyces granulatus TaxID=519963 RepID=A0A232LTF3_9EURO|nr:hypothetical protein Egran_04799 [Elaphomyces granulatus]